MKFIKFSMRNKKDDFTLPMPKAEQILSAQQQTVMVANEDGSWSGIFVNKADISKTDRDYEAEKDWRRNNPAPMIEEPKCVPVTSEFMKKMRSDVKNILKDKKL